MTDTSSGAPRSIGRYELGASLGVGGFAQVYRAYDPALDGEVAIKVLLPHFAEVEGIRTRFLQEARLLRRVDSRNLVKVYDLGELEDGRPYFVMELADGGVLTDRVNGPVDPESMVQIIDAIADGLGTLHEASIVHRDLKPDNLLVAGRAAAPKTELGGTVLGRGERILVGDLGLAKDQDRTSAGPTVTGGTPFYRPPEQMTPGAAITAAADVYAATSVLWFLLTGTHPPDTPAIPAQLTSMPSVWQPVLERGLNQDPAHRYATIAEWAAEARVAVGASPSTGFGTVQLGDSIGLCPYKGMAAFQPEDAGLYFGRDDLVDTLVARLQRHAVTMIGGASGSGKSSLMRAGLLPRLTRGAIAGSQQWRVALFNPGSDAVGELVHQLRRLGSATELGSSADDPAVANRALDRADLPHGARRVLDDGPPALLAIDQFEEVFTLNPNRADQELFLETLAAMTESEHSRIRVVTAIRADFYGVCAAFPWLSERINENQILVGPMSRQELREAITVPAQRAGLQLEAGLADLILDDFGSGSEALPLLGHALMETWIRRRGSTMTIEGYQTAGGVSGAIAQRAEDVFTQLSPAEQETARGLVLQLINPGEGTPDTRRRLRREALRDDDDARTVLETLASARLLTVDESAVEVAHEALIQSWPRLRTWIDENREALQTRRRIGTAAREWASVDQEPDLLYRGTQLAAALDWFDEHGDELDPEGVEFVEASRMARDEADEKRVAAELRSRRNRQVALSALSLLTVAAVIASVIAFVNLRRSQSSQENAVEQQVQALAAAAAANAGEQSILATALAVESMARSDQPTAVARAALVDARVGLEGNRGRPQPFGRPTTVGDARSVAITPDGQRFVTGGLNGDVVFWDTRDRSVVAEFEQAHEDSVGSLSITNDGRWMISNDQLRVLLWDLTAEPLEPVRLHDADPSGSNKIWANAVSPNGELVGLATESEGLVVLARVSGDVVSTNTAAGSDLLSITFVDNERVVIGDGTGTVRMLDARSGTLIGGEVAVNTTTNDVWGLAHHSDSNVLVTASTDNRVRSWRVTTDGLEETATIDDPAIVDPKGLVFNDDGSELIVGSADGMLYRTDATAGTVLDDGALAGLHSDSMTAVAASANGWMVSLADDQQVQIWRYVDDAAGVNEALATTGPVTDLALSPSADLMAASTTTGVTLHRVDDGELVGTVDGAFQSVRFVDESTIVMGSDSGLVRLWDVELDRLIAETAGPGGAAVRALATSDDGRFIASGSDDGSVTVWSGDELDQLDVLPSHGAQVTAIDFGPDDQTVISVGWDREIRFASVDGGNARSLPIELDGPQALAVHPTLDVLAVGGSTESVEILDFEGATLRTVAPHRDGVWDLAFTEDGLSIAAGSRRPAEVRLWDWESGERLGSAFGADVGGDAVDESDVGGDSAIEADVVTGRDGTVWWSSRDGVIRRIDVLNRQVACSIATDVMDRALIDRFLSGDELVSCR